MKNLFYLENNVLALHSLDAYGLDASGEDGTCDHCGKDCNLFDLYYIEHINKMLCSDCIEGRHKQ